VVALIPLIVLALLVIGGTWFARRRGYSMGGDVVVRCSNGHLFTTIWIPGASLKAIRLGWFRLQRCPLCERWVVVTPVKDSDLTDEERRMAERNHDVPIT